MKIRCLSLADYTKIASYVRDLSSQMGYQKRHRDRTKGKKVKTRNMSFSTVLNVFHFSKARTAIHVRKGNPPEHPCGMLWRLDHFHTSPLKQEGEKIGSGSLPADSPNFLFVKLRSNKKTLFSFG
jgi:hypothetical protein